MAPTTEALLMLADRSHHVHTVIEPALTRGVAVVSDRFADSTLAYQGYGRGVDLDDLRAATDLAVGACRPDLTVWLDVSLDVAQDRRARDARDRFESADVEFHERVRAGYATLAARDPDHWAVIDASGTEDDVAAIVARHLDSLWWGSDG